MEDFLQFTKNHVNMNVFKALIRNVDAAGEIQSFQRRLQNILMAFIVSMCAVLFGCSRCVYDRLPRSGLSILHTTPSNLSYMSSSLEGSRALLNATRLGATHPSRPWYPVPLCVPLHFRRQLMPRRLHIMIPSAPSLLSVRRSVSHS